MKDMPVKPLRGAPGIRMIRIDRTSGKRVYGTFPGNSPKAAVIWEAFKPESEPRRSIRQDELPKSAKQAVVKRAVQATGGGAGRSTAPEGSGLQRDEGIY
jgi:penicillin-binding protein 1A